MLGIAGCSGGAGEDSTGESPNEPTEDNGSPNVFSDFAFEKFSLNISLGTTDGYDQIVAFRDGEQFSSTDVTPSAGKVSLDFSSYSPGDYRFAAIDSDDDSVIAETTKSFKPDINFRWKTASETDVYTPENDISIATAVLELENAGNAPDQFTWAAYESETFKPEYTRPDDENATSISNLHSPKSERQYPDSRFKRDIQLPVVVPADSKEQFVDMRDVIVKPLHTPRSHRENSGLGWAVQEGTEYDVTVTVGTKYSGEQSSTRTVIWKEIAEMDSLSTQPETAVIATEKP